MSFPMGSLFGNDDMATGSIAPAPVVSPLGADLNAEDWRRAKGAMALALDPQGNGSQVAWDNPESGRRGNFTPVGQPFVDSDQICRAFLAGVSSPVTGEARQLQGTACRPSGGEWTLKDVKPWQKPA